MWMTDPTTMCRKHLLGEHVELHMLVGALRKGISLYGYIKNDLIEPSMIFFRHKQIAEEMVDRGYNHKSPLSIKDTMRTDHLAPYQVMHRINRHVAREDLHSRCPECKQRHDQMYDDNQSGTHTWRMV